MIGEPLALARGHHGWIPSRPLGKPSGARRDENTRRSPQEHGRGHATSDQGLLVFAALGGSSLSVLHEALTGIDRSP